MGIQIAFTVGVHLRSLGERGVIHLRSVAGFSGTVGGRPLTRRAFLWTIGLVVAAYAVAAVALAVGRSGWMLRGVARRRHLGLRSSTTRSSAVAPVFPAYVWTVVWGGVFGLSWRAAVIGWGVSVAVGMPMMVLGAIVQWHGWLVGVVVVGLGGMGQAVERMRPHAKGV